MRANVQYWIAESRVIFALTDFCNSIVERPIILSKVGEFVRKEDGARAGGNILSSIERGTKAITPDKMDRSSREAHSEQLDKIKELRKPYPLTEEEATPNIPESESQSSS